MTAPSSLDVRVYKDWAPLHPGGGYSFLEGRPKWVAPGQWRATWPLETPAGREFADLALTPPGQVDKRRWQLVVRDADTKASLWEGVVRTAELSPGRSSNRASDSVTVYGHMYTGILGGALIYPDPAVDSPVGTPGGWAVYADENPAVGTAPGEGVLLQYIRDHLGPAAPVVRRRFAALQVPAVVLGAGRGASVQYQRRFPSLLEMAHTVCLLSGLTVQLRQGAPGQVDVVVTEQLEQPSVRFSRATRTLTDFTFTGHALEAGAALVGGSGEGTARTFLRVDATPPAGGVAFPSEAFVDERGQDTADALAAAGSEHLAEVNRAPSVSLTPSSAARWRFGVDYALGDLVRVSEGSTSLLAKVDEVVVRHVPRRAPEVIPTIGDSVAGWLPDRINALARAVRSQLKR